MAATRATVAKREVVVEGEVERVTFESATSSFRVLKLAVDGRRDRLAVVGTFLRCRGRARSARGRLVNDAKHGEQLQAPSVTGARAEHARRRREVPGGSIAQGSARRTRSASSLRSG